MLSPPHKSILLAALRSNQLKRAYLSTYRRLVFSRRAAELIISTLIMFSSQRLLLHLDLHPALWPATGVGLCALFLRGDFLLFGIFLGTLGSYLYNHTTWLLSLFQSTLFVTYLYLIRQCALRWCGTVIPLATVQVLWLFLLLMSLFSALFTFLSLQLNHPFVLNIPEWQERWLSDINGILCLTPFCLIFDPFTPQRYFRLSAWPWWSSMLLLLAFYFFCTYAEWPLTFAFLLFCFYAYRFGQIPTCCSLLILAVLYLADFFSHLTFLTALAITTLTIATYKEMQDSR